MITRYQPNDTRQLLTDMGVGHFNATMLIETLSMTPATTESASAPVMLLVGHLQDILNGMGAKVQRSGYIDQRTSAAMTALAGKDWIHRSWQDVCKKVVAAQKSNYHLSENLARALPQSGKAMGGILDAPFGLPDVPGGLVTYLVGGAILWHALKKKKRASP